MGWCTGSHIAQQVWDMFEENIPNAKKEEKATELVDLFSSYDADCWDETTFYSVYVKTDEEHMQSIAEMNSVADVQKYLKDNGFE